MHPEPITDGNLCDYCGSSMQPGPIGQQCMRCLLSFASTDDAFADVADLFPELSIRELISRGGFGSVFLAEQRRLKRPVALKFLDTGLGQTAEAVELFEKEMISVASLSHPGIVQAYDAGDREGQCYLVMELVDGEDCGSLIRQHGKLPIAESCEIVRQAALALDFAHGKGLVHRDVKPGNLMVSRHNPTVKVLDFGLACIGVTPIFHESEGTQEGSEEHRFLGTLEYIAPEQIGAPDQVDAKADIYALGATLRRMLTGHPAREGMSDQTLILQMEAVTSAPVAPISVLRPDLPSALTGICDGLVALDRGKRPATAAEVARLLQPWCEGAELERLFTAGPLPEKPFFYHKRTRRRLLLSLASFALISGVAVLFQHGEFLTRAENPAGPILPGIPIFSEKISKLHRLDSATVPRLLSVDWEIEREFFSDSPSDPVKRARLRPDGNLIYIQHPIWIFTEKTPGGELTSAAAPGAVADCVTMGVQPGTGDFVWARLDHPEDVVIMRHRADGTPLAPLAPDFSGEASAGSRAAMKALRQARGDPGGYAYPWGFAFVTEDALPPNSGLSPGDVLYADEGHRDLSLIPKAEAKPGIWKFRFDTDDAPQRIGSLSATWEKGHSYFPMDVSVSNHGVFLLNRTELAPGSEIVPSDTTSRVLRWDKAGFHHCKTDLPIHHPLGIAADPHTADLYVMEGGSAILPGDSEQRVLRLRPDGADQYKVEVFANNFMGLSSCGIQITADGQHMVITDERLAAVVVLKRNF